MDITGPPPDGALPVRVAFARPGARELYARAGGDLLAPATPLSAGLDLRACLAEEEARIAPGARLAVPAGISVQPVRPGYAGFV